MNGTLGVGVLELHAVWMMIGRRAISPSFS